MKKQLGWVVLSTGVLVVGFLMGCDSSIWLSGFHGLSSAEVDGAPAHATALHGEDGVTVRLDAEDGVTRGVTLTLGAPLEAVAPGVLDAEAIDLAIESCQGVALASPGCVPTEDAEIEISDLGDGTRRIDYRATLVAPDGTRTPLTGSFVLVPDVQAPVSSVP